MIDLCAAIGSVIRETVGTPEFQGLWSVWVTEDGLLHGEQTICQWFAYCVHEASGYVLHPVLGAVPVCHSCALRVRALA